jgi:hypothetical protein
MTMASDMVRGEMRTALCKSPEELKVKGRENAAITPDCEQLEK